MPKLPSLAELCENLGAPLPEGTLGFVPSSWFPPHLGVAEVRVGDGGVTYPTVIPGVMAIVGPNNELLGFQVWCDQVTLVPGIELQPFDSR